MNKKYDVIYHYFCTSDFLTRQIKQGREQEEYYKRKLSDKQQELDDTHRRLKDLQLRMLRFTKDDQAKDKRVAILEHELRETRERLEEMEVMEIGERYVSPERVGKSEKGEIKNDAPPPKTKVCAIL